VGKVTDFCDALGSAAFKPRGVVWPRGLARSAVAFELSNRGMTLVMDEHERRYCAMPSDVVEDMQEDHDDA
jgi:hypothetical protein